MSMMSTVITRKWFHLVATLLFTPVTIYAPQLQSLSYAVALSLLILVEAIRADIPVLNRFYLQYLDDNKDNVVHVFVDDATTNSAAAAAAANQHAKQKIGAKKINTMNHHYRTKIGGGGGIVVSHMALIVGCAAPLWIANAAYNTSSSDDDAMVIALLGLLGVICLGVGDAVGALVGRYYGRQRSWFGRQGRTLEGSMAMLVSMILFAYSLTLALRWITMADNKLNNNNNIMTTILPSLIFMTILEAYTTQIDNLILPLAGSTMVLLSLQQQQGKP
jgi:dolichol kinase